MPPFDAKSNKRIAQSVHWTEAQREDTRPDVQKYPANIPLVWFLLIEDFDDDGNAEAAPGSWSASADDGDGELTAEPVARYTVRDTTGHSGATEGSWVCCRPLGSENGMIWEPISSIASATKFAKLDADQNQGSSCTASIWSGDPLADSGNNETVYDWFLESSMKLSSGSKVVLTRISGKWYVTQSDTCPVAQ